MVERRVHLLDKYEEIVDTNYAMSITVIMPVNVQDTGIAT